ncbi:MAG: hypothetical protein QOI43_3105 [Gaiellales bacterium]|jgi:hypothetical protein|nr:hypothetical protein [Gaiellales bacterium]
MQFPHRYTNPAENAGNGVYSDLFPAEVRQLCLRLIQFQKGCAI